MLINILILDNYFKDIYFASKNLRKCYHDIAN